MVMGEQQLDVKEIIEQRKYYYKFPFGKYEVIEMRPKSDDDGFHWYIYDTTEENPTLEEIPEKS